MEISGLPGFRDFYPEELALRNHIFAVWRNVAGRYGFAEYDGPPLEPLELYTRKSGAEIVAQLYGFTDKGGREVALRPEMTPSFARMISARAPGLPKPIRWFSIPQLFRYERPQRGRLREHFQLNMDIVGEPGVAADVEIVAAALDAVRGLGLRADHFVARVSDRRLIGAVLSGLGIAGEDHGAAFAALDRAGREGEAWIRDRLAEIGCEGDAAARVVELSGTTLDEMEARHGGSEGVPESVERLREFFAGMDAYQLGEYVAFDAGLVRGLAYYTGVVFELWKRGGELRAICGGGRYDDLLASLGGVDLPAVGFGMGDVVLGELVKDRGLVPSPRGQVQDFIVFVSEAERLPAMRLARSLREGGRGVAFDLAGRSVGRQFKAADRSGAERVIVLGPEEIERATARVREMSSGEETELTIEELVADG